MSARVDHSWQEQAVFIFEDGLSLAAWQICGNQKESWIVMIDACVFQLASEPQASSNLLHLSTGYFSNASYHSNRLPVKNAKLAQSSVR